ncbi:MAG: BON domain-containing protein [Burkholderiales bacterium]
MIRFPVSFPTSLVSAGLAALLLVGCGKAPEAVSAAPSTTVGTEIDDTVVTAAVKAAVLGDAHIKSFDLKVETRKGEVQLSGFVDNQEQVERALAVVRAVAGVKSVDNKLLLKGAPTTVGEKVDDGIVTTRVKAALLGDDRVKSFDIAVVTRKGEVQLSGFVDNQAQIDRALEVTRAVDGVGSVGNDMSIKK